MKPKTMLEREREYGVKLTNHAVKRMAQRMGLRRKSMARGVEKALNYGMGIEDTRGNLRKYLITLSLRTMEYGKDPKILVYSGYIYIFSSVDDTLITTWELPKRFIRHEKPYKEIEPDGFPIMGENDEMEPWTEEAA